MHTIHCIYCKRSFEITQALADQISEEEKLLREESIAKALQEEQDRLKKKLDDELSIKEKMYENEKRENQERIERYLKELEKTNEEMRLLRKKDEERELENQKKLRTASENIREEITKIIQQKADIEVSELKKKLNDTQKALEAASQKSQQKSQQLQGEVLELQLERSLLTSFPDDRIEPVQKGVRGADIKHTVRTARGNICGVILWELKRTKSWSDEWINKLKQDVRSEKANIPIIVSEVLPEEAKSGFGYKDGVLVCSLSLSIPVAETIRQQLISVARERFILEHKNNKTEAEQLFDYITSHEFLQQLEAVVELQREMVAQITREKAAFEKIWKARELQSQKMLKSTTAIAGSLQGIIGNSLPNIKGLELLELADGK